jgi:hypothetical protein
VLIEAQASTKTALPVLARGVYVRQLSSPVIERLTAKSAIDEPSLENQPILPGYFLVLAGKRLRGEITRIVLDGEKIDPPDTSIHDDHIEFPLSATLRAGPHGVQIAHDIAMGSPLVPHTGTESNVLAFLLRPVIVGPVTALAAQIKVKLSPLVTPTQKLRVLLNELAPPVDQVPRAFSFSAPVNNGIDIEGGETETDTVAFDYHGVPAGDFLVRVQVDGAESVLQVDAVTKAFSKPKVSIP